MAKKSTQQKQTQQKQTQQKQTQQKQTAGWPSTTGNPSGKYRDNNPPKTKTSQPKEK